MLATSRGFGDASLKPIVSATPEIFARSKEADDVAIVRTPSAVLYSYSFLSVDSVFRWSV